MTMATPDRILKMRDVHAMVALDTVDMLGQRVGRLLSFGRRISMVRRYTYLNQTPDLHVGLTVLSAKPWTRTDSSGGYGVNLQPGIVGFGFSCYAGDGNDTEAEAWRRFHAAKAVSDSWSERRRDMTEVHIVGGLPNSGPARDDALEIRAWNRDGVCEEFVIGFDYDTRDRALSGEE